MCNGTASLKWSVISLWNHLGLVWNKQLGLGLGSVGCDN